VEKLPNQDEPRLPGDSSALGSTSRSPTPEAVFDANQPFVRIDTFGNHRG
jgi:hypothetical protein